MMRPVSPVNTMKADMKLALASLAMLLPCLTLVCCEQPVNCRWGPYGDWSACDSCSRTKVRTRHVEVYAQFGGRPCPGQASESAPCVPQKGCPLETGCGERFRCTSGQCIHQSLVCNGDQDCEDGLDERGCGVESSHYVCDMDKTPPNSDVTGRGYNILTGKLSAGVINTVNFGGQCRKVFSGDHKIHYRLPQSILRYNFEVTVNNDESDESYESSWSYSQHIQQNALFGHDRRTVHRDLSENKAHKVLILKNQVVLAQFQNSAPKHLPLAEGFWKALSALPLTYDYSAYKQVLQTYGTHYMSEGSLGGQYQAMLEFDLDALKDSSTTDVEWQRCWRKVKRRFFRKKVTITCEKLTKAFTTGHEHNIRRMPIKTHIVGGDVAFIADLSVLDLEKAEDNGENYDRWASSVKDSPDVVNQKLRPLYELVKEVDCAGLRRHHLQRATEEYLAEEHPCHCRPCRNNGQAILTGSECLCVCRPGTSGRACEHGSVIGEQPGVIHGSWSCWTSWSSCSGGQRSRTRSCNNPAPRGGGQHCIGVGSERKPCEEPDIQHLQMMEPQCFGLTVRPPPTCRAPPNLRNGFILDPKDFYLVGTKVEYTCIFGYYLSGGAVAECTASQNWRRGAMECKSATCPPPALSGGVMGTLSKAAYDVGDSVSLSCPGGMMLVGEMTEITCTPSLQWSPSPGLARCTEAPRAPPAPTGLNCKPWENVGRNQCVCKRPVDCQPSLQLCARIGSVNARVLGMCQLGALECLGRSFILTNDSECDWPNEEFTSCQNCKEGEKCDESRTKCVCREVAECPADSAPLCVSSGEDAVTVTMTQCEVGAKRCAGQQVKVVSIDACQTS